MQGRTAAKMIYEAAIEAVLPARLLPQYLKIEAGRLIIKDHEIPLDKINHLYIIGAGKASAAMAAAAEKILDNYISSGIVVTSYGNGFLLNHIEVLEAGHPLPDNNSLIAAQKIKKLVIQATANDLIIFLLSGGASALMADYPKGSSLSELQKLFNRLLLSGADIKEVNTVRKQLSEIKGGRLAQLAFPAALITLIISDVIGDEPEFIGSGPTVASTTSANDMLEILKQYQLDNKLPAGINQAVNQLIVEPSLQAPKADDPVFEKTQDIIIGNNKIALEAAAIKAKNLGYNPIIIPEYLQGEACVAGRNFAAQLKAYPQNSCLLQGGETTVTVKGKGKGGRNQEFALGALEILPADTSILAAGTDGIDGATTAAGAFADKLVKQSAQRLQLDIKNFLQENDSWHFFEQTNGLLINGPTGTNVMDIVIGLVE